MSFGALLCSEEAEEEHWFLVYGLVKCFHQKKKKKLTGNSWSCDWRDFCYLFTMNVQTCFSSL